MSLSPSSIVTGMIPPGSTLGCVEMRLSMIESVTGTAPTMRS